MIWPVGLFAVISEPTPTDHSKANNGKAHSSGLAVWLLSTCFTKAGYGSNISITIRSKLPFEQKRLRCKWWLILIAHQVGIRPADQIASLKAPRLWCIITRANRRFIYSDTFTLLLGSAKYASVAYQCTLTSYASVPMYIKQPSRLHKSAQILIAIFWL